MFSPILRFHSDKGKYYKREPWRWNVKTLEVIDNYLRLRHRLIPYLYTESYRYHKEYQPLIQPLYYNYPEIIDEPLYKDEYYLGKDLLIAPITKPKDLTMNRSVERLYLPKGTWYDFKSGKKFIGNKNSIYYKRKV